jgi:hypothetical protein
MRQGREVILRRGMEVLEMKVSIAFGVFMNEVLRVDVDVGVDENPVLTLKNKEMR